MFWAKALHGNDACMVHGKVFVSLRTQALAALGLGKAGVNPLLRLTLSGRFEHDPEFFHLRRILHGFRRLCHKDPQMLTMWSLYMHLFDGQRFDGPFSKLLSLCNQLGWELRPPHFVDHDGCLHHFLSLDTRVLDELLEDAWLQQVAVRVSTRTSMKGLKGLDRTLSVSLGSKLTMVDTCLVASLQSGAFIAGAAHSRLQIRLDENTIVYTLWPKGHTPTLAHLPGLCVLSQ